MSKPLSTVTPYKSPLLILCSGGVWLALMVGAVLAWLPSLRQMGHGFLVAVVLNTAIWWLVLLWGLYHLAFQVGSLFARRPVTSSSGSHQPSVAILYVTCDDFSQDSCLSCLNQTYRDFHLFICDDSESTAYRSMVDGFVARHGKACTLVRRSGRLNYKAGNLNYAIECHVGQEWDWLLLVDADQWLPSEYLAQLARDLPGDDSGIAFVQGAHTGKKMAAQDSHFQRVFSLDIEVYYARDLVLREPMGFLPLLGHGALIRRSAWESAGKFPPLVSEDFAFSLEAVDCGWRGIYRSRAVSREACPWDFGGFGIRLRKYAAGTAELVRKCLPSFLVGPASFVEKWDFVMQIGMYALMPLVTANGFYSAYIVHRLWSSRVLYIHSILPYLYTGLLVSVFVLRASFARNLGTVLRFYFWSTAIGASLMPIISLSFLTHLFRDPTFSRTPKNGEQTRLEIVESCLMVFLGIGALVSAWYWPSTFSLVLAGQGIAYLSYPLYGKLCSKSFVGWVSRLAVYVPGAFMIAALSALYVWGT